MLGFIRFISFWVRGDSEAVKGLKDGVVSGGFMTAGASTARRCGDLGVRSVRSDSARGYDDTHEPAQLTSSGHLSVECLGSVRHYRGVKVKSVKVTRQINGAGTLD